jgi:NMD protein affecting ribosome stability and mRNA decay
MEPAWRVKSKEGKMFTRLECDQCLMRFHFSDTPRVTRVPRCPQCGSYKAHQVAA